MTPENSFVIFQSKKNEIEGDRLLREKWYNTPYCIDYVPQETLDYLRNILPTQDMNLNLPPQNEFIPRQLNEKKVPRDLENTKPAMPKRISENPTIWFK